jgi:hypothetical protein
LILTTRTRSSDDVVAVLILIALWLLFFWRLFTPIEADQASIVNGDFSAQFVAFAAYQYQRLSVGEIPLWNPYNNGGLPFIADTQAAVFYPPRLLTIGLSKLAGGWTYHALELEMTVHVLGYSLLMYLLMRRMTLKQPGSVFGAFVGAVIAAYGGFMSGYPPLQLAILEAGVWLPLAALGIHEATRADKINWRRLALTGLALGLSWMAGHPQTSWFLTYLLLGYFGWRVYQQRCDWKIFVIGAAFFGLISFGLAAVQLIPGVEYLARTSRTDLGFDAKGNGFPFQDVIQFIFPNIVSLWSPLYVGIVGLVMAVIALWRRLPNSLFWGVIALLALILSFGANSAFFHALYNLLPGLRFFRGQERAAYLVANSLAILAGMGAAHLVAWDKLQDFKATRRIQQALLALLLICALVAGAVTLSWLGNAELYGKYVGLIAFSAIISVLTFFLIPWLLNNPQQQSRLWLLAGLIVFEFFTVNMDGSNYEPVPPQNQLPMTPPPLIAQVLTDTDIPFRVDGFRGLGGNFGSLYNVMDMRGISPLFLNNAYELIEPELINPLAWELFAVRYVYTDWQQLPVPSQNIGMGEDRLGPVNLHRLSDPRPFAILMYDAAVADSDDFARALLRDPNFSPRQTIILNQESPVDLPEDAPENPSVTVASFQPESFTIEVNTPANAILSISHPDYPGWQATIDGETTDILRAYGSLSAVAVPQGNHSVHFVYNPLSYRIGAILSLLTWTGLALFGIFSLAKSLSIGRNKTQPV